MGADRGIVRPERERRAHRRAGVDAAADDDLSVPEGTNRGHESERRQQARMSARARRHEHQPVYAERRRLAGMLDRDDVGKDEAAIAVTRLDHFARPRSEAHTSELQSLMRTSYAVFCLKKNMNK